LCDEILRDEDPGYIQKCLKHDILSYIGEYDLRGKRMLDFGCGAGDFTERFLSTIGWPPGLLELALVEPVAQQRDSAARRLARFSHRAISTAATLPVAKDPSVATRFDLILSNHVLYYVDDLDVTLARLLDALAPAATLLDLRLSGGTAGNRHGHRLPPFGMTLTNCRT
jgi:SAM-dependent methyltransferase